MVADRLTAYFIWLLRSSLEASLVICVLLVVLIVARGRWTARWTAAVWLLLVLRLVSPWLPDIRLNPIQFVGTAIEKAAARHATPRLSPDLTRTPAASAPVDPGIVPHTNRTVSAQVGMSLLSLTWIAGVLAFGGQMLVANARLWMAVRQAQVLTNEAALKLLESCKELMGIKTLLGIVVTDKVRSPALFGLIRPRLLLPAGLLAKLTPDELQHVFLHELSHLKRFDIYWGWATAVLQVLHWFNPLIWYAFHQSRIDRELACDESTVAHMSPQEAPRYGRTLIKLLESMTYPRSLPSLAGVSENTTNVARRIRMIARLAEVPRTQRARWTWPSVVAFALLASTVLTGRVRGSAESNQPFRPDNERIAEANGQTGRLEDRVDHPFVNDPELIGGWRSVDFVPEPDDFDPLRQRPRTQFPLGELHILPEGRTDQTFTWTKGFILHLGEKTASRYEIRRIEGKHYLFFEWKSGDYTIRDQKPSYYVLAKDDRVVHVKSRTVDEIDYPFVDDPEAVGVWESVDFVESIEDFVPERRHWPGGPDSLYLKRLELLPEGETSGPWRWTKGLLLHPMGTASRYSIEIIDDVSYMFLEWKSGDYVLRQQRPHYYVLTRAQRP